MAVKVERYLDPVSKVEVVRMVDAFGAIHLVQQPILPLVQANGTTPLGQNPDGTNFTERDIVRDWHEATIDMERTMHCRREVMTAQAAQMLGHPIPPGATLPVEDPLDGTGWRGCCG